MSANTLLLQLSDPHFGTERAAVCAALLRLAHSLAPSLLVLSGDLTQRARRAQFAAARAFAARLRIPAMLAIPGNHDIPLYNLPARVVAPYAGFRAAFGDELEPVFESPALLVLGVNTTRPWRHKHGEVSPAQVERVAQRLQRATPGQLRMVVTHQPALAPRPEDHNDRLRGGEAALRRWVQAGADLVLGGHIHLPSLIAVHERLAGLGRRAWTLQAGTALSRRIRHEADCSVNLVRREAGRPGLCRVERWDYGPLEDAFVPVEAHDLVLDRGGAHAQ